MDEEEEPGRQSSRAAIEETVVLHSVIPPGHGLDHTRVVHRCQRSGSTITDAQCVQSHSARPDDGIIGTFASTLYARDVDRVLRIRAVAAKRNTTILTTSAVSNQSREPQQWLTSQ